MAKGEQFSSPFSLSRVDVYERYVILPAPLAARLAADPLFLDS